MTTSSPVNTFVLDGSSRKLDPKVRMKWVIQQGVLWLVIGVVIAVTGIVVGNVDLTFGGLIFGIVVAGLALVSASLMWRYWSWAAHGDALELIHGVLMRKQSVVPYHRIQQIDITRDPLDRMLGLSTLILRSAAATTDAKLPGIAFDETEPLRHALLAHAGVDDAV